MRELKPSRTPWREALKYNIRTKPRQYNDTNWAVCLKQYGNSNVWKHYPTEEEAWDMLQRSREEYLVEACASYGLHPDDAKVFQEKYLVFDNGMVFNMHGTKLEGCTDNHGYLGGSLGGVNVQFHILVASLFLKKPHSHCTNVAHKDGNKLNNSVSNLKWTNMAERWEEMRGANSNEYISKQSETMSRLAKQLVDNESLRSKLPKVGMCLRKRSLTAPDGERHDCVVTYVNPRGLWYEVQFMNNYGGGFKECFKLPEHTPNY